VAQITAIAQTQIQPVAAGTTPPLVIQYNASSVPSFSWALRPGLSEMQLNDPCPADRSYAAGDRARCRGSLSLWGKQRQVQVDLNLPALQSKGLSPADVVNAISAQNLILPSGTIKIGQFEYQLETNSAPATIQALNDLPIRQVNGAMVYIHDVAHVRNAFRADQHRACRRPARGAAFRHQDGQRSTLNS